MNDLPVLGLVFLVTATAAFLGFALLNVYRVPDEPGAEPAPFTYGPITPALARLLPATSAGVAATQQDLLRAGRFEPVALDNFQATRSLLTFLPLVAGETGAVLTDGRLSVAYFVVGLVSAILGYALPRLVLANRADARTEEIRRGLPVLMDALGLTLSTGGALPQAFAAAGQAIRRGHPELAREVRLVCAQGELRSMAHTLDRWKERQPIPELASLAFLLGQAERLGTDITTGLKELSESIQITARQRAEAAANRANFFMLFPTVFCLLVAAGLVLAGPGVVQLVEMKREVDGILRDAKDQQKGIRQAPPFGERPVAGP